MLYSVWDSHSHRKQSQNTWTWRPVCIFSSVGLTFAQKTIPKHMKTSLLSPLSCQKRCSWAYSFHQIISIIIVTDSHCGLATDIWLTEDTQTRKRHVWLTTHHFTITVFTVVTVTQLNLKSLWVWVWVWVWEKTGQAHWFTQACQHLIKRLHCQCQLIWRYPTDY